MHLPQIRALLSTWAAKKPLINRLWLFGSRVREEHRPESDLDIAIELDVSAAKGLDDSGGIATWMFDTKTWKPELELLVLEVVDLQRYKMGETNIIQAGIDRSSILVYEKPKK
jgi:predicted nucleotidyltransferase